MKHLILIIALIACNSKIVAQCPVRRTFEPNEIVDSTKYDCVTAMQIVQSAGISDTVYKRICIERNAVIFIEGRTFSYNAIITDSISDTLSVSEVTVIGTNKRFNNPANNQVYVEMVFNRFMGDSVTLHPISENLGCCDWLDSKKEGIIENVERVWMHPIRSNQYLLTETACFPEVFFPLVAGKKWSGNLQIHQYGSWAGLTLENQYSVIGKKTYSLNGELLECWELMGVTSYDSKQNKLTYLFNERFGFVLMRYEFHNGVKINFNMTEAIQK